MTEHHQDEPIFDKVLPDAWRDRVKQVMGDLRLPKEAINHLIRSTDETKNAAIGIIAKEVRRFLEQINLADEMAKLLEHLSLEVTTTVRFVPNTSDNDARGESRFKINIGKKSNSDGPATETPAPPPDEPGQ